MENWKRFLNESFDVDAIMAYAQDKGLTAESSDEDVSLIFSEIEQEGSYHPRDIRAAERKFSSLREARGFGEGTPPPGKFYEKKVYVMEDEGIQEDLEEKKLTKPEKKEKERLVKGMKPKKSEFKKRYGKGAKEVMYRTATKMAKERK
tara:strand:+ start:606 stop:1049 length:444 start_codon:yes stop_codon:yes gene_type:complete